MEHNKPSPLNENKLQFPEEEVIDHFSGEEGFFSDDKADGSSCAQGDRGVSEALGTENALMRVEFQREALRLQEEVALLKSQLAPKEKEVLVLKERCEGMICEMIEVKKSNNELSVCNFELQQKLASMKYVRGGKCEQEAKVCLIENQDEAEAKQKEHYEKEHKHEAELSRLTRLIDELKKQKTQLLIENKVLSVKLINSEEEKQSQLLQLKKLKDNEITLYKQKIDSLKHHIASLSQLTSHNNLSLTLPSFHSIGRQLKEVNHRIKVIDEDNDDLRKQVKRFQSKVAKSITHLHRKDILIEKLQSAYDRLLVDSQIRRGEFKVDPSKDSLSEPVLLHPKSLTEENEELKKKNEELENGLIELNANIKVANDLFQLKYEEFEADFGKEKDKNREYRRRIEKLKLKVNELHANMQSMKSQNEQWLHNNRGRNYRQGGFTEGNGSEVFSCKKLSASLSQDSNSFKAQRNLFLKSMALNDPYENSQKQSIEDYRKTFNKLNFA